MELKCKMRFLNSRVDLALLKEMALMVYGSNAHVGQISALIGRLWSTGCVPFLAKTPYSSPIPCNPSVPNETQAYGSAMALHAVTWLLPVWHWLSPIVNVNAALFICYDLAVIQAVYPREIVSPWSGHGHPVADLLTLWHDFLLILYLDKRDE